MEKHKFLLWSVLQPGKVGVTAVKAIIVSIHEGMKISTERLVKILSPGRITSLPPPFSSFLLPPPPSLPPSLGLSFPPEFFLCHSPGNEKHFALLVTEAENSREEEVYSQYAQLMFMIPRLQKTCF